MATFVRFNTVYFCMKGYVFTLLTLTCLLVLPAGNSYACGKKHIPHQKEIKYTYNKKICFGGSDDYQTHCGKKKKCGHSCNGCGCDCAHSSSMFALKTHQTGLLQKPVFLINQTRSWFFKESAPKPVYLSLWMPPNINC